VPVARLPPGMASTLQVTRESVLPVTVAVKVCVTPRSSEAVAGVTTMLMEEGTGAGVGVGDGG